MVLTRNVSISDVTEVHGPLFNIKSFPGLMISIKKIRQSRDRLIFIMGTPKMVKRHLYIETAPAQYVAAATTRQWAKL